MPPKRVILAEYFISEDGTLLFIIRNDFDKPEKFEIKKSLTEIRKFVIEHFGEKKDENGRIVMTTGQMVNKLDEKTFHEFFQPFVAPLLFESSRGDPIVNSGDIIWFCTLMMYYIIFLFTRYEWEKVT